MIFQEPMSASIRTFTVGDQISEAYRAHFPVDRKEGRERAIAALAGVGIPAPERRCDDYPHQQLFRRHAPAAGDLSRWR